MGHGGNRTFRIHSSVSQSSLSISQICLCIKHVSLISARINRIQYLTCLNSFTAIKILTGDLSGNLRYQIHFLLSFHKTGIIIYQRCITLDYLHGFDRYCSSLRLLIFTAPRYAHHQPESQRCRNSFFSFAGADKIKHTKSSSFPLFRNVTSLQLKILSQFQNNIIIK